MAEILMRPDAPNCWYGDSLNMFDHTRRHLKASTGCIVQNAQGVVYAESNCIGIPARRIEVSRNHIVLLASSRMGRSSARYAMPEESRRDLEPDCLAPGSCPLCSCGCPTALWAHFAAFDTLSLTGITIDDH